MRRKVCNPSKEVSILIDTAVQLTINVFNTRMQLAQSIAGRPWTTLRTLNATNLNFRSSDCRKRVDIKLCRLTGEPGEIGAPRLETILHPCETLVHKEF